MNRWNVYTHTFISDKQKIIQIAGTKLELHITQKQCQLFLQYTSKTDRQQSEKILELLTINPCGYVQLNRNYCREWSMCLQFFLVKSTDASELS